jgi:hypothetical protein
MLARRETQQQNQRWQEESEDEQLERQTGFVACVVTRSAKRQREKTTVQYIPERVESGEDQSIGPRPLNRVDPTASKTIDDNDRLPSADEFLHDILHETRKYEPESAIRQAHF